MNRRHYKAVAMSLLMPLMLLATGCGGDDTLTNKDIKADYYKGKTITWVVSGSAGGGTDVLTRVYAPFLSKYLEGHPKVEFKYLTGGGGIEAGNYIYNVAKKDGLTLATLGSENMFSQILGEEGVEYDFQKVTFLGNFLARDQMLFLRKDVGIDNFDELLDVDEPPKVGARRRRTRRPAALILQGSFPERSSSTWSMATTAARTSTSTSSAVRWTGGRTRWAPWRPLTRTGSTTVSWCRSSTSARSGTPTSPTFPLSMRWCRPSTRT